jgi:hypothetical protein
MISLGTFHHWFALVCRLEANELVRGELRAHDLDHFDSLLDLSDRASANGDRLGVTWDDSMQQIGGGA